VCSCVAYPHWQVKITNLINKWGFARRDRSDHHMVFLALLFVDDFFELNLSDFVNEGICHVLSGVCVCLGRFDCWGRDDLPSRLYVLYHFIVLHNLQLQKLLEFLELFGNIIGNFLWYLMTHVKLLTISIFSRITFG
jgi:hypothetical protein